MLSFTASCISNSHALKGANQDNLLFSGQILPEANGGLSGVPTAKFNQDTPFLAAVFDGQGSAGAKAACFAAGAFRAVSSKLTGEADLSALLAELHNEFSEKAPADTGVSALAVLVSGDRLCMAAYGSCRAYLFRNRALYVLTHSEGQTLLGVSSAGKPVPYVLSGGLQHGDQLLLCTDGLYSVLSDPTILRILATESGSAAFLQKLRDSALEAGAADSITAIALRFD